MNSEKSSSGAALRAASAIRNISRGAAVGGLPGAAAGAVKSFLPEIMKITAVLLILALMLPFLVFAALPNILFGFDSAIAHDIAALTEKAEVIADAYEKVREFFEEGILSVVEDVKNLVTLDGILFDDVEVDSSLGNMSIEWFIAITSVSFKQDLFAMDADAIKNMAKAALTSSFSLVGALVGGNPIVKLFIKVTDLDPVAFMTKLAFSEEEYNWAQVLHKTMAEDQSVSYNYTDGAGYYGSDYGDIVFTDAATPVVYYNQTDSRWGNILYGTSDYIKNAACGPTALAIVVSSLTPNTVTPDEVAKWSVDNGHRVEGSGSSRTLITQGGRHYGLTVEGIGHDAEKLVEALKAGKLVIAIMTEGHFTKWGHFIVLRGVTSEGKILVADPASVKRSNQEWDLYLVMNELGRLTGEGGPLWVMSYDG